VASRLSWHGRSGLLSHQGIAREAMALTKTPINLNFGLAYLLRHEGFWTMAGPVTAVHQ
jgi:hypothetical protein